MAEFSFTYRAFISYAHADHAWAVWLHRALERYRVPRRLAGLENLRRLGKIFRDEEELAAAAELGPKIDAALKASDVLIVVCSPRSAKSKWVSQEIEAFKKLGRENRVFALIVDGTPHGAEDECFPEALKRQLDGGPAEPLAVDVRKFGRDDAALRLVAGLLDIGYDDLKQRELRRRRAEMFRAQALFAAGLVLVAAALVGGYFAASNYVDASEKESGLFAREANRQVANGDDVGAILTALAADPAAQAGPVEHLFRPTGYARARQELERALGRNRLIRWIREGSAVKVAAYSPDGRLILVGCSDGSAKLRQAADGAVQVTFQTQGKPIVAAGFSADGAKVVTAAGDQTVGIWNAATGEALATFKLDNRISAVALSPDGSKLLVGYELYNTSQILSTDDGAVLQTFKSDRGKAEAVAFSPDGNKVFIGQEAWPITGGEPIATFHAGDGPLSSVAFSADGHYVLTGSEDGSARVSSENGREISSFAHSAKATGVYVRADAVTAVALSPEPFDSEFATVLTGSGDGSVKVWPAGGGAAQAVYAGDGAAISSISFAPDGNTFLTGAADGSVKIWAIREGEKLASFKGGRVVLAAAFSPDGTKILTGSIDGRAVLWPSSGGAPLAELGTNNGRINGVSFSTDGTKIALALAANKGAVKVLDAANGGTLMQVQTKDQAYSVAFSPDGASVLVGDMSSTAQLLSIPDGKVLASFDGVSVAISPDGKRVATGTGETVKLWAITGGQPVATLNLKRGGVRSVAFSPDSAKVLAGSEYRLATLWSVDGPVLATFEGQASEIFSVAFTKDGSKVALGAGDGSTKLYSAAGGEAIAAFTKEPNGVLSISISPDGKRLVTASYDGVARVWAIPSTADLPASSQVDLACSTLRTLGVTSFSQSDYRRIPLLERGMRFPCEGNR